MPKVSVMVLSHAMTMLCIQPKTISNPKRKKTQAFASWHNAEDNPISNLTGSAQARTLSLAHSQRREVSLGPKKNFGWAAGPRPPKQDRLRVSRKKTNPKRGTPTRELLRSACSLRNFGAA